MDSGATSHATRDYNNMAQSSDYGGMEQVVVGNGNELNISYVGKACLKTYNGSLILENVLWVLEITKNLVNVSKLAKENGAFFEFHADNCLVKDVGIGRVVLKGDLKNGLYKLKTRSFVIGNASSVTYKSLKSECSTYRLPNVNISVNMLMSKEI